MLEMVSVGAPAVEDLAAALALEAAALIYPAEAPLAGARGSEGRTALEGATLATATNSPLRAGGSVVAQDSLTATAGEAVVAAETAGEAVAAAETAREAVAAAETAGDSQVTVAALAAAVLESLMATLESLVAAAAALEDEQATSAALGADQATVAAAAAALGADQATVAAASAALGADQVTAVAAAALGADQATAGQRRGSPPAMGPQWGHRRRCTEGSEQGTWETRETWLDPQWGR
ncbi:antifreeze protein Maxi-like [Mastacembelus armatus]|uniref:antifreeze protein Maxi-like n=1 Tax=Mastacembelus armatus TaxID=205130 RepID=UPI000E45FE5D|nr:antifreeze protein Maxi-like [Mastacembelus armatus]